MRENAYIICEFIDYFHVGVVSEPCLHAVVIRRRRHCRGNGFPLAMAAIDL